MVHIGTGLFNGGGIYFHWYTERAYISSVITKEESKLWF